MNRKGFTLIEVIITISLIAVVAIMFTNSFDVISKNNRRSEYNRMVNAITNASNVYVESNYAANSELYVGKGYLLIQIKDLIENGNISINLNDPTTQKPIDPNNYVYIIRNEFGSVVVNYPHENAGSNECFLETTPIMIARNSTFNSFNGLNAAGGIRLINNNGNTTTLVNGTNIEEISNNVDASTIGTYTVEYRYRDCADQSIWRNGTRTVIVY